MAKGGFRSGGEEKSKEDRGVYVVTGGAGFVGSRLALRLQDEFPNDYIIVIDDFRSGSFKNLQGFKGDVICADLGTNDGVDVLRRFAPLAAGKSVLKAIFHNAAITDTKIDNAKTVLKTNVEGFRYVLDLASTVKCKLIYASSSAVYGQHPEKRCVVGEQEDALNMYAFSKLVVDNLARRAIATPEVAKGGMVGLRYFNVYGPGEDYKGHASSYIYQIYRQLLGLDSSTQPIKGHKPKQRVVKLFKDTASCRRDWVHVDDVVQANLLALECNHNGIYNVGSGKTVSFEDLVSLIAEALGLEGETVRMQFTENNRAWCYQRFTCADLKLTQSYLKGYDPQRPKKAIKQYIQYLKERNDG